MNLRSYQQILQFNVLITLSDSPILPCPAPIGYLLYHLLPPSISPIKGKTSSRRENKLQKPMYASCHYLVSALPLIFPSKELEEIQLTATKKHVKTSNIFIPAKLKHKMQSIRWFMLSSESLKTKKNCVTAILANPLEQNTGFLIFFHPIAFCSL